MLCLIYFIFIHKISFLLYNKFILIIGSCDIMKKFFIVFFLFFSIVIFSIVGYKVVSANEVVDEVKNIIDIQNGLDKYFSSYGYTVENPNIIVNPYGISPLTALVLFETKDEVEVHVKVVGKDEESSVSNSFLPSKKHIIPIYGLYAGVKNKVIVKINNISKEYVIETEKLPDDFKIDHTNMDAQFLFANHNYPYAIDKNNEVRWFINKKYSGSMQRIQNGHFLLGSDVLLGNGYSKDILEIDLLGKIYYQYYIPDGYYGSFAEVDSHLFVLSKQLLDIDKQSGVILEQIPLDNTYSQFIYQKEKNQFLLKNNKKIVSINRSNFKISDSNDTFEELNNCFSYSFYINHDEYKILRGVKFSYSKGTKEANKRIFLVHYKEIDDDYLKYDIQIKKGDNYLQVLGNISKEDDVYIILDKFLDKRIYSMNDHHFIIHQGTLNGRYSIYIQINGVLYRTNRYVDFS